MLQQLLENFRKQIRAKYCLQVIKQSFSFLSLIFFNIGTRAPIGEIFEYYSSHTQSTKSVQALQNKEMQLFQMFTLSLGD